MLAANRPLRLTIYALLAAILYLPGLGRPALWEPDEGRYAEIAREMVVSGDYVTPRDDFELYFEKPPLVYWADAASIGVFGANEFAVRLPAALFSVGQVVITAALAEVMLGATAGFFAALALALSPLFFGFARFATLDPALAFFLTAALCAFYVASRDESFSSPSARRWMLLSAAMLALGTLAKGPVALLLGGAIPFIWLAFERRLAEIRAMPLAACLIIYALIVVPWFVLIESRNPGFLSFFFVHEHLQRYVTSSEHGWGPWFFIPIVIGGAWPWIFFVPLGWSAMRTHDASPDSAARRSAASFLAIWFVVIFVFFSIPRSKLGSYILPAMPPLAIVAGYGLARLLHSRRLAPPPSVRRRCDREPGTRRRSLRIFRIRTGADKSCARPRRTAARLRTGSRPNRDVLAGARAGADSLRDCRSRDRDARDGAACGSRAPRRVPALHLSRPRNCRSALPRRQLHARLLPPLRAIASVLHSAHARPASSTGASCLKLRRPRRASRRSSSAPRRACARRGLPAHAWF